MASGPFEHLDEQDEKHSSKLVGRVHIPIDAEIAKDIAGGKLTDSLRSWLEAQNPRWEEDDLNELTLLEGDVFWAFLCEDAAYYGNRPVLDRIPEHIIQEAVEDLQGKITKLEALISITKFPVETELDEAPDDFYDIVFLNRQQRAANRKEAGFDRIALGANEQLRVWLIRREWSVEDANYLAGLHTEEDIVSELINHALEYEDYGVIQSIPQDHAEMVVGDLHVAIEGNRELLNFINPDAIEADAVEDDF